MLGTFKTSCCTDPTDFSEICRNLGELYPKHSTDIIKQRYDPRFYVTFVGFDWFWPISGPGGPSVGREANALK